jgi:outer membrane immunogenic protein
MKAQFFASALILGSMGLAHAADPVVAAGDQAFSWEGSYIGAHIGYGWGKARYDDSEYNVNLPDFPPLSFDFDANGVIGGLQFGHNWQRGNLVYGLEGDLGYLNLAGSGWPEPDADGVPYDTQGIAKGGWYAGLAARVGYAADRTLFYVKGGAVYSGGKLGYVDNCISDFIDPPGCGPSTLDAWDRIGWGYQIGTGVEHALRDNWTVKLEYAYLDFGSARPSAVVASGGEYEGRLVHVDADLGVHTIKLGINYRF